MFSRRLGQLSDAFPRFHKLLGIGEPTKDARAGKSLDEGNVIDAIFQNTRQVWYQIALENVCFLSGHLIRDYFVSLHHQVPRNEVE